MSETALPVASVLPSEAILLLQKAARTPVPEHDPLARERAINEATLKVKHLYPQFFK